MAIADKKGVLVSDDHPRSSILLKCRNRNNCALYDDMTMAKITEYIFFVENKIF